MTSIEDDISDSIFASNTQKTRFVSLNEDSFRSSLLSRSPRPGYEVYCDINYCFAYAVFTFQSGNKVTKITRKYTKAADVLGYVGGFFALVMTLFQVFYCCCCCDCCKSREKKNFEREIFGPESLYSEKEKTLFFSKNTVVDKLNKNKRTTEVVQNVIEQSKDGIELLRLTNELTLMSSSVFEKDWSRRLLLAALTNYAREEKEKSGTGAVSEKIQRTAVGVEEPGGNGGDFDLKKFIKERLKDLGEDSEFLMASTNGLSGGRSYKSDKSLISLKASPGVKNKSDDDGQGSPRQEKEATKKSGIVASRCPRKRSNLKNPRRLK